MCQNCGESHQASNHGFAAGQGKVAVVSDQAKSERVQLGNSAEVAGVDRVLKSGTGLQFGH